MATACSVAAEALSRHGSVVDGRRRAVIEHVTPQIDGGRYPIKRVVGDVVVVEADAFADGHGDFACCLLFRKADDATWIDVPMAPLGNDRWRAVFEVNELGCYRYTIQAWADHFATWQHDLRKKVEADQNVTVELQTGAVLLAEMSQRATGEAAMTLKAWSARLAAALTTTSGRPDPNPRPEAEGVSDTLPEGTGLTPHSCALPVPKHENARPPASGGVQGGPSPEPFNALVALALSDELAEVASQFPDRHLATTYDRELAVIVDRERARYSTWYELFPRSTAREPGRHGTLQDCEERLPYVAAMGFDVLYLPPIHPIGQAFRKGRNNATDAAPGDPGSPWGIGAAEGGHFAIHPELGTLDDFRHLVSRAHDFGLEVALDLAFQCSPDHPWVTEHPEWFVWRPDGTIQYAENPPKKYQDIYPLNFESAQWRQLWDGLMEVVLFWIEQGVRIFRVDNPHTKPFQFWEWLIGEIKSDYPDVIFLAEAFTRPKLMSSLAKGGFSQSYTYFTWRNTKTEIAEYFTELTQGELKEYFRPNLWPNTPDILSEYLQFGGRPAFIARLVLAATLGASYGIYGPAFELAENQPVSSGREEYLDSEKYQIRHWPLDRADSLQALIARVNRIRRENPALQRDDGLHFHQVDNDQIIAYSKSTPDRRNVILTVVNVDPDYTQSGWGEFSFDALGLDPHQLYQVHDLLTDARYLWHGPKNHVEINPRVVPAHIFRVRRRIRTERDFDYYS